MKKSILAVVLVMVFVFASVIGVSAAGSSQGTPSVSGGNAGSYIIRTDNKQFTDDRNNDADIVNKQEILQYNAGTKTLKSLLDGYTDVYKEIEKKSPITKIFDLHDVDGGQMVNNKHVVTLYIPTLTESCSDVKVLHYSVADGKWEILKESSANTAKRTVTVVTDDLSPIAIFATVKSGSGSGQSPATGTESLTWMIWAAAAVVVLGSGVVIARKRK